VPGMICMLVMWWRRDVFTPRSLPAGGA